jgi:hypothetical protein
VEHLEISCFQEQSGNAGQSAVQQFHTEAALLASPSTFSPALIPAWMDSEPSPVSAPAAAPAAVPAATPATSGAAAGAAGAGQGDLFSKLYSMLGQSKGAHRPGSAGCHQASYSFLLQPLPPPRRSLPLLRHQRQLQPWLQSQRCLDQIQL